MTNHVEMSHVEMHGRHIITFDEREYEIVASSREEAIKIARQADEQN